MAAEAGAATADDSASNDPTVDDFTLDNPSAGAADAAAVLADPEPWETNGEV
jgi:hypothetical protein